MKTKHHVYRSLRRGTPRVLYRIPDHDEAGAFESMTGATIWALRHLRGFEWRVEPFHEKLL